MEIIFAYTKNQKAKIKVVGKTLRLLTLLVAISKYLAERISEEKGVSLDKAEDMVVDCFHSILDTINYHILSLI